MRKLILTVAAIAAVSAPAFAGGLLTNTNQNAIFLRNPARDAVIAIDGVYSNPAGIAFLPKGLHLSLSWQAAFQKRQITSTFPTYALNASNLGVGTKYFEGKAQAPVIPSVQAAYVFNDKWSVSAQFAVGGGGGKCEFDNGLATFEKLVGGQMGNQIAAGKAYTMTQNLTGEQYFYGIQVGGTYKFNKYVSAFVGVRGIIANCGYEGAIRNISFDGNNAAYYSNLSSQAAAAAGQYAAAAEQYAAAGDAASAAQAAAAATQYKNAATQAGTAAFLMQDYVLDCQQSDFGIQPIIGVDVNLGKLNLAAKYEFGAKIELENESNNSANVDAAFAAYKDGGKVRSDIPALLTVGAQYEILKNVRTMAGFHYYFDKDAKGSATAVSDNTWEVTFGAEWDITKKFTVSAGVQRTQYGFDDADMSDMNFNISSTALCLGASYRVNDMVNINAGYMHSFYEDHEVKTQMGSDLYTRKNDVFGVSVDLHF